MAVKKVGIDNDLDDIMKEIEFMKGCRSPYIVRYFGSYFKDNELWVCLQNTNNIHSSITYLIHSHHSISSLRTHMTSH